MVAELAALVIFVIMFLLIVLDRIPRQWVTLGCGALMLVLVFGVCMHDGGAIWDTLNLSAFGQSTFWYGASESSGGINWSTIVFIAGMMVMVEGMGHVGIFRWLCLKLAKAVHYRTVPLLVCPSGSPSAGAGSRWCRRSDRTLQFRCRRDQHNPPARPCRYRRKSQRECGSSRCGPATSWLRPAASFVR